MNKYIRIIIILAIGYMAYAVMQQRNTNLYERTDYIGHGMSQSMSFRNRIHEYYSYNDSFPSSNEELSLSESNANNKPPLLGIYVTAGGHINIYYDDGGELTFIPEAQVNGQITWACITPSYEKIAWCEYTG